MDRPPPPVFRQYNGHFVHPRLLVGGRVLPADVPELVAAGVRGIINVASVAERHHLAYVPELPASINWRLMGFWDGWRSATDHARTVVCPLYAQYLMEQAAMIVRDHSPVLIHCMAGIGRSGNVAAMLAAALDGVSPETAISGMKLCRPQLAGFSRDGLWRLCDPAALVARTAEILRSPAP